MPLLQPSTTSPSAASIKKQTALKLGIPVVEKLLDVPSGFVCKTCEQLVTQPKLLTITLQKAGLADPNLLDKYLDVVGMIQQLDLLYDHHHYVIVWDDRSLTCPKCWEQFVDQIKKELSL